MAKFSIEKTELEGLLKINYFKSNDNRGGLIKDFCYDELKELGVDFHLIENFYTISKKGVIRANHFQVVKPQTKIIRVVSGKIFDVVVDLRKDSKTYKKWVGFYMDENTNFELFIPKGFSHGYLVLEDSIVSYKTDEIFIGEYDSGFQWNDPEINIEWPLDMVENKIILSDKDKNLMSFSEYEKINKF